MIGWSASDQQTFEENIQLERERPKSTNMIKQILTIKYLKRIDNAENRIYQKINWYPQFKIWFFIWKCYKDHQEELQNSVPIRNSIQREKIVWVIIQKILLIWRMQTSRFMNILPSIVNKLNKDLHQDTSLWNLEHPGQKVWKASREIKLWHIQRNGDENDIAFLISNNGC